MAHRQIAIVHHPEAIYHKVGSTIRATPPFLSPNAALRVRQPQEKIAGEVLADELT